MVVVSDNKQPVRGHEQMLISEDEAVMNGSEDWQAGIGGGAPQPSALLGPHMLHPLLGGRDRAASN